jgi:16S rRNA processing protein RimM
VDKNGTVSIGKIVGAHGLDGTCKVYPYSESSDFLDNGCEILILPQAESGLKTFEVDWSKPHNRLVLLSLKGVNDRTQAESLIGSEIVVEKASLPKLDSGTYYWHELIGLRVYTNESEYLGQLEAVMATGSNDVYVVKKFEEGQESEVLIPALNSVVIEIDTENKTMRVDLPEGL